MQPEKYAGDTCFETFLVQFKNCAEYNCWTPSEKLHYLRWSLSGSAARMLWGTEHLSYDQLVNKLRSQFGSIDQEERYQAELQCCRRKPNESLRELASQIRHLMQLAYPGDRSIMSEHLAKEHFICALDDYELELKVREREPRTLDAAVKFAQRLEVFKNTVKQRRNRLSRRVEEQSSSSRSSSLDTRVAQIVQDLHQNEQRSKLDKRDPQDEGKYDSAIKKRNKKSDKRVNRSVAISSDDSWKADLLKKVQDLETAQQAAEANTKKITAENTALNKEVERLRYLEQMRAVPSTSGQQDASRY